MKFSASIAVTVLLLSTQFTQAQKPEAQQSFGMFPNQQEYSTFMGSVKTLGIDNPEIMAMVPMINDIVLNNPIGSTESKYNTNSSPLGLLSDPDVRADLEMVDDQYNDLQKMTAQLQRNAADQFRSIDFSDSKNAADQMRRIRDQNQKEMENLLLPHQLDRLRQISTQSQLRFRTLSDILTSEPVRTELEISETQGNELRAAEREIEKELAEQIEKLRADARQKLVGILKPEQKEKAERLIGDLFKFKTPQKPARRGK